jgi:hypothetical protein
MARNVILTREVIQSRNCLPFYEPYPEPHTFTPYPQIVFHDDRLSVNLASLPKAPQVVSYFQTSHLKRCKHLSRQYLNCLHHPSHPP